MTKTEEYKDMFPLEFGENNPVLRKKCLEVKYFTKETKILVEALAVLMWEYEGVGIAAPQIWQTVRIAAVTQRDTSKKNRELLEEFVMINPILIGKGDETVIDEEACLSLPKITGKVARPLDITIKYQTIDGKTHIKKATGYNARILLHEMDHLDGVLFIDKLV